MQRGIWVFMVLVMLAIVALSPDAGAQSIQLPSGIHRKQPFRPSGQEPNWVNRADCLAKDVLTFTVTLRDYAGYELDVWAGNRGVDCTSADNQGDSGSCYQIYGKKADSDSMRVDIAAVDLVARGSDKSYPAVCQGTSSKRSQLSLTFVLVDSDGNMGGKAQVWNNTGYDVSAPKPPTNLSASEGETRIFLDFDPSEDVDVRSYRLYCDPPRSSVLSDGGVKAESVVGAYAEALIEDAGDADAGGGATTDAGTSSKDKKNRCVESTVLAAGADPAATSSLDAYVCGSVVAVDHTATIDHLVNNVDYTVAVASVDELGNVGVLSHPVCDRPIPVTDFFELYRAAGGKAGGGFCAMSRAPNPDVFATMCAFGTLAACAATRRARRDSRTKRAA